jgi:hypothetical protein
LSILAVETPQPIQAASEAFAARTADIINAGALAVMCNAAPDRQAIAASFASLDNDYERAAWAYLSDRDLFQAAEELQFFDHYAEGPSWSLLPRTERRGR